MSSVLHHTRASCAAQRTAEELCGGAGTSTLANDGLPQGSVKARSRIRPAPRPSTFAAVLPGVPLLLLVTSLLVSACGVAHDEVGAERRDGEVLPAELREEALPSGGLTAAELRLDNSVPTLDALGEHVLTGLSRQDTAALNTVRLTETEHNEIVWPELPASAPDVNFPVDYAWTNIQNRNTRGLSRLLNYFADRDLGFQRVECRGGLEVFETFAVETDCFVVFTVDHGPGLWEAQLFKDVLVRGGGHKIFRYYDEEPRPYRGSAATRP